MRHQPLPWHGRARESGDPYMQIRIVRSHAMHWRPTFTTGVEYNQLHMGLIVFMWSWFPRRKAEALDGVRDG